MKRGQKTLQKPGQNGNTTGLRTRNGTLSYLRRHWMFYAMLVLPVLYYFLFCYRAMPGVVIAFKDYNIFKGIWDSPWVGLEFFERVAQSDTFWRSVRNTMVLNILGLVVGFPLPIILALFLNEINHALFKKGVQTIIYLPHFISWSVIGGMMYQFFASSGLINTVVKAFGGEAIPFLTNKPWWIFTYFIVGVWKSIGWNTIIYLSAMTGIDQEIYEAARVDGGSELTIFWKIIMPLSKPVFMSVAIFTVVGGWGSFLWPSLILKNRELHPIGLALLNMEKTLPIDEYLMLLIFAIVPPILFFILFQKYIMEGVSVGGIKG